MSKIKNEADKALQLRQSSSFMKSEYDCLVK